jgi:hypothetical protein
MFYTPADHTVKNVDIDSLVRKPKGTPGWRPGGPQALRRMTTAAALLECDRASAWANVGRAWCCQLMGANLLYIQQVSLKPFLCLGSDKWMWYGIELERVDHQQTYYVLPAQPTVQILPLFPDHTMHAPYFGMTVEPLSPGSLHPSLQDHGLVFQKIGFELEPVVPFALRNAVKLNRDILALLCADYRCVPPPRRDRKPHKIRELAESLVGRLFPNEPQETKDALRAVNFKRSQPRSGGGEVGTNHPSGTTEHFSTLE